MEAGGQYGFVPGLPEALVGMKKRARLKSSRYLSSKEDDGPGPPSSPSRSRVLSQRSRLQMRNFVKNLSKENLDEVKEDIRKRLTAMREESWLAALTHRRWRRGSTFRQGLVEIPSRDVERREQERSEVRGTLAGS